MTDEIVYPMLPTSGIAEVLGRDVSLVRKLVREGYIPQDENRLTRLDEGVRGYIRYRDDLDKNRTKTHTLSLVQEARAEEINLRIAKEKSQVVDAEEIFTLIDGIFGGLKSELDGLPARCTRDREVRNKIAKEMNDLLRRSANRLRQEAGSIRAGRSIATASGTDSA